MPGRGSVDTRHQQVVLKGELHSGALDVIGRDGAVPKHVITGPWSVGHATGTRPARRDPCADHAWRRSDGASQ